ncbi:general odorant-binding protein 84a [Anopheles aquasalis]|uniref:general odorant-binding protein 84a n=1 Tax=Anopheles aquasalis TaxID=42839 RepID=UPI00215AFDD2|nr:general odorant-binding protein 84a [Anopheles aquasalis]
MEKPFNGVATVRLALLLAFTLGGVVGCSMLNTDSADQRSTMLADPATVKQPAPGGVSPQEAITECNRTFIIQTDYWNELNETGSFPDETDRIPLCFVRCYLQTLGILTEDMKVNKEAGLAVGWGGSSETIDECLDEMTGTTCEMAYYLMRCVITRALVEGKSKDNK